MAALVESQLILTWSSEPLKSSQQMNSMSRWPSTRQVFLPRTDRRATSVSVPRCAPSFRATMPPRKVNQTNSQRDSSSDTAMPELAA